MPRQFANVLVLSLVAIGVAGLMLSTLSAIGAEGVSYAERIGLIALWVAGCMRPIFQRGGILAEILLYCNA